MGKYRKIDPRIWNDEKFRSLSDNGKLCFFYLLTHPHMTSLGAMRASVPGLASEIGWTEKAFRKAFEEASRKGMLEHDPAAAYIGIPKFLKYNGPESPNVVKSWLFALDLIPECKLKDKLIQRVKAFLEGLDKSFAEALPEAFRKPMPNQEQEQEQEQEQKVKYISSERLKKAQSSSPEIPPAGIIVRIPLKGRGKGEYIVTQAEVNELQQLYPAVDVEQQFREMRAWSLKNPIRQKTQRGVGHFINSWLAREQDKSGADRKSMPARESLEEHNLRVMQQVQMEAKSDEP